MRFFHPGSCNTLKATFTCPRCGGVAEAEAKLFFGACDGRSLRVGARYPWRVDAPPEKGGRPEGGDADGEGEVECPRCGRDFVVVVRVRADGVESFAPAPPGPGTARGSIFWTVSAVFAAPVVAMGAIALGALGIWSGALRGGGQFAPLLIFALIARIVWAGPVLGTILAVVARLRREPDIAIQAIAFVGNLALAGYGAYDLRIIRL